MSEETTIIPASTTLPELARVTPMSLLEMAVSKGADINTIERLVALQEKMLARESEMAFNAAMNKAQQAMGRIAADLTNPQTRSQYASYAALDRKVRPVYTEHGFSLSFDTGEAPAEMVRAICHVSHEAGFTRTYHVDMPADGKGAKGGDVMTKTHATGAAMSYGQRYLLKYIFNIAIGEDDTDGNTNGELIEIINKIAEIATIAELQKYFLAIIQPYKEAKNSAACNALIQAKDKRKAQLQRPAETQVTKEGTATPREDGTVELDCTILDVRAKAEQKDDKGKTTSAGYIRIGINSEKPITCWHQHLWPALSTAKKNDRAVLIVKEAKGYLNLEDVELIGMQKFKDGKPVLEGE